MKRRKQSVESWRDAGRHQPYFLVGWEKCNVLYIYTQPHEGPTARRQPCRCSVQEAQHQHPHEGPPSGPKGNIGNSLVCTYGFTNNVLCDYQHFIFLIKRSPMGVWSSVLYDVSVFWANVLTREKSGTFWSTIFIQCMTYYTLYMLYIINTTHF